MLADGRELIYFDDADTTLGARPRRRRRACSTRGPTTATMRQDPLTGEWVSIAAARQNRVFLPPADQDPLAPQTPANPSEIPSNYDVAVFENRSPSFGPQLTDDERPARARRPRRLGLGRTRTSVGRCEVVCFSPEHEGSFGTPDRVARPHRDRGLGGPHRRAVGAARASSRCSRSRTAARRSA